MTQDMEALRNAVAQLWTRDSPEGVRLANEVVNRCADLLDVSAEYPMASNRNDHLGGWWCGHQPTSDLSARNMQALEQLARAREDFADHARAALGRDVVELFTLQAIHMPPTVAASRQVVS